MSNTIDNELTESISSSDSYDKTFETTINTKIKTVGNEVNQSISYEEDYDDFETSDVCSVDLVIDYFTESLLPADYEQTKRLEPKFKVSHLNETIAIIKRLEEYSKNVSEIMKPIIKRVMPRMTDILLTIDLEPECMASLARIGQSAQEGQQWALKYFDSQPAPSSGILKISSSPLGEFDQCLEVESPEEEDKSKFFGQYCHWSPSSPFPPRSSYKYGEPIDDYLMVMIDKHINSSMDEKTTQRLIDIKKLIYDLDEEKIEELFYDIEFTEEMNTKTEGICLPTTCHPKDVEFAINKMVYPITKLPAVGFSTECEYKDKPIIYDNYQIFSMITYAILIVLSIISTIFEFIQNKRKNALRLSFSDQLLRSFSLISNTRKVISLKFVNEKFSTVDGIRAIFSFYMFMIHVWYFPAMFFMGTKSMASSASIRVLTEFKYVLLISMNAQQVFFLIGGMNTSYLMFSKLEKSKSKFNYIHYAIYRYLRVIFPLVGSILMVYLQPLFGDGPLWAIGMKFQTQSCYKNLKASLLMYSNYYLRLEGQVCNFPSWYTSADFQLYLIAPLYFLILYNKPKIGYILTPILLALGSFAALSPKILYGIPHYFEYEKIKSVSQGYQTIRHHFFGTEQHVGNYALGIFLGYLIKYKPNIYFGGRIGESFIWILTALITFWGIIWNKDFPNSEYTLTQTELLLWIGLDKHFWTAFWFWLIYMGATGRGSFINKFFEWNGFKLISNISLEIYLVHCFPIFYRMSIARDLVFLSDYYLLTAAAFDFLISCILGLVLNLLVTTPFTILVNLFLLPQKRQSKNEILHKNEAIDNNNHIILKDISLENGTEVMKTDKIITRL